MNNKKLLRYAKQYRTTLLDDVIPFWMKHSPDPKYGGYLHCLDADGSVINTDKYMWPQNREIWIFSMLYNHMEKRRDWLDLAKLGVDFLKKHGRDENGDWYFALTREGRPLVQPYNIFSDCFAVIAFSEYARASGDEEAMEIALKTYGRIQKRKDNPKGKYNKAVGGTRSLKNLAVPMININISSVLREIRPDSRFDEIIDQCIDEVMNRFIDPRRKVIHENVTPDGKFLDDCYEGRHVNPGHGIEAMWFIMSIAAQRGDTELIRRTAEAAKWCMEFGWDDEYDGIFYFLDKFDKPHIELHWDMKLWWPHLEALVALLMGYYHTGDAEMLKWFQRVHDYSWSHFPDQEHGEWFGYLNRQGEVNNRAKANKWKCCFHLPRALFLIPRIIEQFEPSASK